MLRAIARSLTSPLSIHNSSSNRSGVSAASGPEKLAAPRRERDSPRKKRYRHDDHHRVQTSSRQHTCVGSDTAQLTTSEPDHRVQVISSASNDRINPRPCPSRANSTGPSSPAEHSASLPVRYSSSATQTGRALSPLLPPEQSIGEQSVQPVDKSSVTLNIPHDTTPIAAPPPTLRLNSDDLEIVMQRKVWVKRPGASATRVEVNEADLFDNVRDVILRKYANSLGRSIDSPDITLKIISREQANNNIPTERVLSPEESVGQTLDAYYPGGQSIQEALVIEVPQRRTPKPSPRPGNHHLPYFVPEDYRPGDGAHEYFPPMPLHSPHIPHVQHATVPNGVHPVHSMSVLTTGQVPPLPSPGGHSSRRHIRPRYGRQHTSSPTVLHSQPPNNTDGQPQINGSATSAPSLPTPPVQADHRMGAGPSNRPTSPHPNRVRKKKQPATAGQGLNGEASLPALPASAGLLDGRVPPINVLIVEDNMINLRLLEQFMRRLKVRWKSAMNGKEAVSEWRQGGFHLVLMDIQLPVMNGLEATKEIRRLESINGIGLSVFGDGTAGPKHSIAQLKDEDKLEDRDLFKSPVIIVALTASSLQSDRHEALAVGCNDFLTKPVNFGWMERKVTEWGCMQALIDFDGWRKWKEIEAKKNAIDPEIRKQQEKEEKAKQRASLRAMFNRPPPSSSTSTTRAEPSTSASHESSASAEEQKNGGAGLGSGSGSGSTSNPNSNARRDGSSSTNANAAGSRNGVLPSSSSSDQSHATKNGEQPRSSGRRSFRARGNGSGSLGSLPTTAEVDERSS